MLPHIPKAPQISLLGTSPTSWGFPFSSLFLGWLPQAIGAAELEVPGILPPQSGP